MIRGRDDHGSRRITGPERRRWTRCAQRRRSDVVDRRGIVKRFCDEEDDDEDASEARACCCAWRVGRDQADRAISTGQLRASPPVHTRPIDVLVWHGSSGSSGLEGGFPLRCFQRLSRPHLATRLCDWRHNRSTRGASIPVLSY